MQISCVAFINWWFLNFFYIFNIDTDTSPDFLLKIKIKITRPVSLWACLTLNPPHLPHTHTHRSTGCGSQNPPTDTSSPLLCLFCSRILFSSQLHRQKQLQALKCPLTSEIICFTVRRWIFFFRTPNKFQTLWMAAKDHWCCTGGIKWTLEFIRTERTNDSPPGITFSLAAELTNKPKVYEMYLVSV